MVEANSIKQDSTAIFAKQTAALCNTMVIFQ